MRKLFLLIFALIVSYNTALACGPDYSPDREYYNLFMQEIINDSQYYPFLLTLDNAFWNKENKENDKNENIEEWQEYFKLSYNATHYLVFKTSKKDIDDLIAGVKVAKDSLKFADKLFVDKYKQALKYLSYAKYLEPYMAISGSDGGWDNDSTADLLDYKKVTTVLKRSWSAENEKELKLRYGYQLVRFAHYNRNYQDAIDFFNTYVEPLNYRPAMYYHALSQKAGSERGKGDILTSNVSFFKVFSNSKDLKEIAARSIRFNEAVDYNKFLDAAKTDKEKNDAYLLLGYYSFNDPLRSVEKIIVTNPDAIQVKVLIARAVNTIERSVFALDTYFNYYPDNNNNVVKSIVDKRYPLIQEDAEIMKFYERTSNIVTDMVQSPKVRDKDFWYITGAYLYFMNKKFDQAKDYLSKVKTSNSIYDVQKKNLAMYIDISEHPAITSQLETQFYKKYKEVFETLTDYWDSNNEKTVSYSTQNFVLDVLANRYFLQKDYAKSFLLNNKLSELENNPQLSLIDDIESFYKKKDKTDLEKFIANNMLYDRDKKAVKVLDELNYMRGVIYMTKGDLDQTLASLQKTSYGKNDSIPSNIFGYNKIECFSCDVMATDYLQEFPYVKEYMNMTELTKVLIQLKQEAQQKNEKGAKANYLFGNFYYNVTSTGYHRSLLRFRSWSNYTYSFFKKSESDIYGGIYLKYYGVYYENPVQIAQTYLENAYLYANDNELKARIVFALSKCEQENHYQQYYDDDNENDADYVMIRDRKYFKEMMKYKNTQFFNEVKTNCKYFDYYVNNYGA